MRRVVVTGYGAFTPIGSNAKENWKNVSAGRSGVVRVSLFDTTGFTSQIAGEITSYNPKDHFSGKDLKKMDRFIQLCLIAGKEAVEASGLDMEREDRDRVGSCVGVGMGGLQVIQDEFRTLLEKGPKRVSPFFIPAIIPNLAAGQLAIKYGFRGPNLCTTTACSSSAHSIGESFRMIRDDVADVMVSGGTEAVICELGFAGFCSARALSTRNDDPQGASRPFANGRDGFVIGEGAAILVVEELEHARKRGANILGEIIGYGANCDGYHITQPTAGGEGAAQCMRRSLNDAGVNADQIDYINTHGTSTPLGDIAETRAVKIVFGSYAKEVLLSSTKSMTGHLLGAAGAVEAMFCLQAIEHQVAPPTINLDEPDPECDLNYVPHQAQEAKIELVLSNSFGFGGTNASLVMKKFS